MATQTKSGLHISGSVNLFEQPLLDSPVQSNSALAANAPFVSFRIISSLARCLEVLLIIATGYTAATLYPGSHVFDLISLYLLSISVAALIYAALAHLAGSYTLRSLLNPLPNMGSILALWSMTVCFLIITLMMTDVAHGLSRLWLLIWLVGGAITLLVFRVLLYLQVKRWNSKGQLNRRAALVGGGETAFRLFEAIDGSPHSDVRIIGFFDDRSDDRVPKTNGPLQKLGNIDELIEFVRHARVDMLLVTLPAAAEERLLHVLKRLWVLPVDVRLSAHGQKLRYRPRAYSYLGEAPFLDLFDKPLGEWGAILKALEDRIIAVLAVVLLSPVFLLLSLAVKLDSRGPVFFRQKRYGLNNELIEVFKFRTMHQELCDANAERLATRGDPRVTRVGRFLRRTSLDEIPQLFNVLNGSLSLVGPRPHPTRAKAGNQLYNEAVEGYFARHKMKPGITGWAQVNGWRGETDTQEKIQRRVEHDLYYIENWSLAFDLYILAKTPLALLQGENAY